jgi:flagellar FliJ protein
MGFRYRLQKIVDLKNSERMQAEWVLSQAVERLNREEHSLARLSAEKEEIMDRLAGAEHMTISELQSAQHYLRFLDEQIGQKNIAVDQAKHQVLDKRRQLNEKMLVEKIWNQARDKAYHRFLAEERRQEQKEIDEIATVRFAKT